MKRILALLPVILAFQVCVSPALAWTWPVDGPVLRPFMFDRGDPYAGGQHRGVDIGADIGAPVAAPVAGTVTFAGAVPGGGLTLAIRTADGYSATLVHLGSIALGRGAAVREGAQVGAVGATGRAELGAPHVHLGVRIAGDEQGYVDPLAFLPPRAGAPPPEPAASNGNAAPKTGSGSVPASESPPASAKEGGSAGPTVPPAAGSARRREDRTVGRDAARRRETREQAVVPGRVTGKVVASGPAALTGRVSREERAREPVTPAPASASRAGTGPPARVLALVGALITAAGLTVLRVRRQIRDAAGAHRPAAVLAQGVSVTTEHTGRLRPGEHDHVFLDEDLERVLLAEAKALPDLDRNDDATELVDVPDDSGCLPLVLRRRGPQGCLRSHRGGRTPLSWRSLR